MSLQNCGCSSPTSLPVNTPGVAGESSFTTTSASFTVPAANSNVSVSLANTGWMVVGAIVAATGPFHFQVISKTSNGAVLKWLNYSGDGSTGATVASGSTLAPAGIKGPVTDPLPIANGGTGAATAAAAITALINGTIDGTNLTDNTTGSVLTALAAGAGVYNISIPHTFIGGTSAVEPATNLVLGHKFKILSWRFVTEVLLVGAAGSRVANLEINTTDVGTVVSTCTIPIANAAVGTVTAATAVSGANTGTASDSISIEIASGGTAFTAGSGTFIITVQNSDIADALASINNKLNDVLDALTP